MHNIFDMYEVLSKPEERSDESYRLCYMLKARALFFSNETRMLSLIYLTLRFSCRKRRATKLHNHPKIRPAFFGQLQAFVMELSAIVIITTPKSAMNQL